MGSTTNDMLAFLEQLKARVAHLDSGQQQTSNEVSDSDDENEGLQHSQGQHYTHPLRVTERTVSYTNEDTYKGSMLGDQRHGQGTHTTSTGDVYTGGWQYDQRHGQGTFKAASGMVYEGSWRDDKATGSGRCSYPDGSTYEGDWQDDERSGWGTLTTADGQTYEGEWEANAPHGEGQWTFADGLSHFRGTYKAGQRVEGQLVMFDVATKKPAHTYTGRFKKDMRHGPDGVGVEEGLWVYRGGWQEDSRSGHGHCRYTDGSEYEGEWLRDMRHGSGRMKLSDGTVYDGQWREDKLHGAAKAKYASGEAYIGHWQHGQRHGHGKWISGPKAASRPAPGTTGPSAAQRADKEVRETYVGGWVAGKREGHGVAEYADGGRYEGLWRAGLRHGHGLMLFADGTVFRGAWEDDEWVQSAAEPALCRMNGPGLSRAVAGQRAEFVIEARDHLSNPRLNGGDTFQVLLLPATQSSKPAMITAAATPLILPQPAVLSSSHSGSNGNSAVRLVGRGADDDSSSASSSGASVGYEGYLQRPAAAVLEAVAVGDVQDRGDGTYSCSYSYTVAGAYELHVMNGDGEHVAGSPSRVQILPGAPSPRHSTVSGSGRSAAVAGNQAEFTVTFRDAFGNPCPCPAAGCMPACQSDTAVKPDGNRNDGKDSSFGGSLAADILQLLEARLVGSNTLTVADVHVAQLPGGVLSCSYTAPAAAGMYVLEVTAGAKHVGGSPFSVKVAAQTPATLSAAATARAAASSAQTTEPATPHSPPSIFSRTGAAASTPASAASKHTGTAASAPTAAGTEDRLRWWGDLVRQAYEAIDGSLQGFEEDAPVKETNPMGGMSAQEAEMVKANPSLPVVERLEDLWLLGRLQQERKVKQQQQQQQQQHVAKTAAPKASPPNLAQSATPPASKEAPPVPKEPSDALLVTQQASAELSSCGQAAKAEDSRSPSWLYELD